MRTHQLFKSAQGDKKPTSPKRTIRHLIVIGDSLTDRGVFYSGERIGTKLLLAVRMFSPSPQGRFTNGWVWLDYLATNFINQFSIKKILKEKTVDEHDSLNLAMANDIPKKHFYTSDDISDAIISKDKNIQDFIQSYTLRDPKVIPYHSKSFVRCYAEGGLCNHNYNYKLFSKSLLARLLVPYLSNKVDDINADDQARTLKEKQETLSLIWSGMNDISLVNKLIETEYHEKIRLSVNSLKENIETLMQSGYCHFLLFNAPDATLAPRFIESKADEMKTFKECITTFNLYLRLLLITLKQQYPNCSFEMYDANAQLKNIFDKPSVHGLDETKINKSYLKSSECIPVTVLGTPQPGKGYAFWDDVHLTTSVHEIIARDVEAYLHSRYQIEPPLHHEKKSVSATQYRI